MNPDHVSEIPFDRMNREELLAKARALQSRAQKLQELVEIISRGKYMWESTFDAITAPVQIVSSEYEILRANVTLASAAGREITSMIGRKSIEVFEGPTAPCE